MHPFLPTVPEQAEEEESEKTDGSLGLKKLIPHLKTKLMLHVSLELSSSSILVLQHKGPGGTTIMSIYMDSARFDLILELFNMWRRVW